MDFIDGVERNKQRPDTFEIPSQEEKDNIEIGNYIKVGHNRERFWGKVLSLNSNKITIRIDNDLVCEHPFKCDDEIQVEKRNVLDILSGA